MLVSTLAVSAATVLSLLTGTAASAVQPPVVHASGVQPSATKPPVTPQPVAAYFADGLIPRLIDLYGSGNGVTTGIDFDATTLVGPISRVMEWTPDFLAGHPSSDPTRLTNNWVAPVSLRGDLIGLATVWINPADDQPELASFDSAALAQKVAAAPRGSILVHDPPRNAWFALSEDSLIPLVRGTSTVSSPTTPEAYQQIIANPTSEVTRGPSGVAIAALVLGIVILGVAVFVLLPIRKRTPRARDNEGEDEFGEDAEGDDAGAAGDPDAASGS